MTPASPFRDLFFASVLCVLSLPACSDDEPRDGDPSDAGVEDAGPPPPVDAGPDPDPILLLPRTGLEASELAVLVAEDDPVSEALGAYYIEARNIPEANLIRLPIVTGPNVLSEEDFSAAVEVLADALPEGIQAFLLTWTQPYRVECMSITSAFALGFDERYCNRTDGPCGQTAAVPYFDAESTRPLDDFGIRPAMMLPVRPVDAPVPDAAIAADAP